MHHRNDRNDRNEPARRANPRETREEALDRERWQGIVDRLAAGTCAVTHAIEGAGVVVSAGTGKVDRRASGHVDSPKLKVEFGPPRYKSLVVDLRNHFLSFEDK